MTLVTTLSELASQFASGSGDENNSNESLFKVNVFLFIHLHFRKVRNLMIIWQEYKMQATKCKKLLLRVE